MTIIFHYLFEKGPSLLKVIAVFVLGFSLTTGVAASHVEYQSRETVTQEGLKVHNIYTPTAFTHTYNYITD